MRQSLLVLSVLYILLSSAHLWAQEAEGIEVNVTPGQVTRIVIAVPPAINTGEQPDTIGASERILTTLQKSLTLSGYFDLLERELYPQDPEAEGMTPNYVGWFNSGSQGLIKVGFALEGEKVRVVLRLFDIDEKKPIALKDGVDQPVLLERKPQVIQAHVFRFVNRVIEFYTGAPGFFGSRVAAVRRSKRGKSIVLLPTDGGSYTTVAKTGRINILPSLKAGRIYFTSYRDGGPFLYRYDSGKVKRISNRKGINVNGELSPDGRFLATTLSHQGSSEIYLLEPNNGKILRRLTRNKSIDISPTWSPDGRKIAFVSDREGSPQIWVMNVDGSGAKRVTFVGQYNQSPSWSPKGDTIAFTGRDENFVFDIFTINPNDPSQLRRLTQNQGNNEDPSFSPDGRHVAFSSSRTGRAEIFIMTADGFTQRQLSSGGGFTSPSWGQ
jgi:TolB protein